ncbi:PREDICTED: uncharacterized protein LOC107348766 isoform X1 [Acropora digitifera]|uniref:uncharacterized protein LOC107348766 isoform X1 n=1 Tax=Acropora digitifera TaxID=70779 RepID=UPI00077A0083|nr:PREDICTED: uncharacterized protein LOC107348766 isoform X1 [Acropora digitifera]
MASSTETGEERLIDAALCTVDMDPFKVLCFLSEGKQNKRFKRRCMASAVVVNGQYLLLTSSSAIKDEDKKENLILKRFSRKHFGRYTVEACFLKEFGEFTFLKIKGTPQDNGRLWYIRPLNVKLPSSENLRALTSPCAMENFKFKFKCDGEKGTIELISKRPVEETSIVGAPIIIEQSGRFSVIGVVGLTSERQLCPCYLNESILAVKLWKSDKKSKRRSGFDLEELVSVSEQSEVSAQSEVLSTPPPMQEAKKRVLSWKKEDVAKWLESIGFDVGDNGVRGNLDGRALCKLNELRKECPEFFYSSIKTDLALSTVIDVMKFSEELMQLLN